VSILVKRTPSPNLDLDTFI